MPSNVVLLQGNPHIAQTLAVSLAGSFHAVHVTRSLDELRNAAAKLRPGVIIVDLEAATFADVEALKQQFASIRIICNHRVADEEMWTRSLTIGADDCCPSDDTRGILHSAVPQKPSVRRIAA